MFFNAATAIQYNLGREIDVIIIANTVTQLIILTPSVTTCTIVHFLSPHHAHHMYNCIQTPVHDTFGYTSLLYTSPKLDILHF